MKKQNKRRNAGPSRAKTTPATPAEQQSLHGDSSLAVKSVVDGHSAQQRDAVNPMGKVPL